MAWRSDPWNGEAASKLFKVKSRSELKSIPVLLRGEAAINEVAVEVPERVRTIAEKFWPGPLTIVVRRKSELPSEISATDTIGVRAPDHKFANTLLRMYGPIAATSANLSGQPAASSAEQVVSSLSGMIDLIVDGGESAGGVSSTVVDFTANAPELLREGPISQRACSGSGKTTAADRRVADQATPIHTSGGNLPRDRPNSFRCARRVGLKT